MLLLVALALSSPTHAVQPDEMLKDPVAEARARKLSAELRCLVCQNESIDDSNAPLAKDLRILVRERVSAGASDDAIRAFLVSRYGEFVLLKPPFARHTALLYVTPFLALSLAGLLLWRRAQRMSAPATAAPLSDEEKKRLEKLLSDS